MLANLLRYFIDSDVSEILGEYYTYKVSAVLSCALPCILVASVCVLFFFFLFAIFRGFFK